MGVDLSKITVEEYTTPSPQTVAPGASVEDVWQLMKENNFRHIPVVDNDQAIGIISERDLNLLSDLSLFEGRQAVDVMTKDPFTVNEGDKLDEVAFEMSSRKIGSAVVNGEDGKLLGIFTSTDALNALIEIVRDDVEA